MEPRPLADIDCGGEVFGVSEVEDDPAQGDQSRQPDPGEPGAVAVAYERTDHIAPCLGEPVELAASSSLFGKTDLTRVLLSSRAPVDGNQLLVGLRCIGIRLTVNPR
jgi:hypothetical protein